MILKAKHHFLVYPFFKKYAVRIINKRFHGVELQGNFSDKSLPVLLISNHISWWDGFWAMYLNVRVLKRRFHFMMREDQLRKYRFFNFTGGFSVNKSSRSMLESLNYASSLLRNSGNMVLIFPQGKIQSVYNQHIDFQKGIESVLRNFKADEVQILFMANLVDYFSERKPTLFMYIEEYNEKEFTNRALEENYNRFYSRCVAQQTSKKETL